MSQTNTDSGSLIATFGTDDVKNGFVAAVTSESAAGFIDVFFPAPKPEPTTKGLG